MSITLEQRLFITIDVDWNHDDVTRFAVEQLVNQDIPVTVFLTHDSPLLEWLRAQPLVELGVHPDFTGLLGGEVKQDDSAEARLKCLHSLIPEATCIRTHGLVQSSRLSDRFADLGYTHEVNNYIPAGARLQLGAWQHWSGTMLRVPYIFDDSLADHEPEGWSTEAILDHPGLRIVNFHPARLFLNYREVEISCEIRACRNDPQTLATHRRSISQPGSRSFLQRLVGTLRDRGGSFGTVREIQPEQHK